MRCGEGRRIIGFTSVEGRTSRRTDGRIGRGEAGQVRGTEGGQGDGERVKERSVEER